MANTKVPAELSSTPGIIDNSTATALTIDSAGAATFSGTVTADGLTTNTAKLKAIAKDISDTAVDVFVYDTRKDSDGGAWRHRTQHTSWYNEALNTSTRGATKKFPSVAVIVAESDTITIYDGDDPDMPMWMVFNGNAGIIYYTHAISSVTMLNGILAISRPVSYGVGLTNFVSDSSQNIRNHFGTYTYIGGIVDRNASKGSNLVSINPLINGNANDVAMTVLPNAPIDADTGLPVPTIAVATDGGVSVIKDDGTVVDITHTVSVYKGANNISFNDNQLSYATQQSGSGTTFWRKVFIEIPSVDTTGAYASSLAGGTSYDARGITGNKPALNTNSNLGDATNNIIDSVHDKAFGFSNKLTLLDVFKFSNANVPVESSVAYITSDYNTGWMNGDIKLATLSDTDTTNVTGTELVTNGTFDSNTTGWAGNGTLTQVSGRLRVTGGQDLTAYQVISTVVGKYYTISFDVVTLSGTQAGLQIINGSQSNITGWTLPNLPVGSYSTTFLAGTSTNSIIFGNYGASSSSSYAEYDNISVRLAEPDRSVNNNGLQVFGTVTKTAVATGAELVAYSGFSASNYLAQPYNSDLDFGTGDFSYMGWVKWVSGTGYLFDRADTSGNRRISVYPNSNGAVTFYTENGYVTSAASILSTNVWAHLTVVRCSGLIYGYHNGVQIVVPFADTGSKTSADGSALLKAGVRFNNADALNGSIALLRASATVPSTEQIIKIYNDEKFLFQENAKATLYGASDAVTALAYDDDTELLHVGTSAGRSVFQGLNRVDNTTDAVGVAISASNGLVAED